MKFGRSCSAPPLGLAADDAVEDGDAFMTVACAACLQSHFVNVPTGVVLGDLDDD